ncbi:alpha-L-fucosidase [Chitinophaga tropicalis]|uniref:alpha-L-fucosidase n=1 Tax=Chitinophaga tropicalis TaxID=2683588 RepID=A0A7K1U2R6_9BACT|nr:alpha-L-fucosidase [Chitinophaga tropicalis]MVT08576.1 alpha-L-fucosidase [Chitinophaga tropicalis]
MRLILFSAILIGMSIRLQAQAPSSTADKGDEQGLLMQKGAERDQAAINEALNGWWKHSMENHDTRIAWWREDKFGCFIHWGVYSAAGGEWNGQKVDGYAEHLMRKEKISRAVYQEKLLQPFNPEQFNADAWVRLIKAAGMRYLIITSKHHDGVAMYPSKVSDLNISASTFKRDPMQELSAACKKYGIRFGFYYSHAYDWEHPDAPGNDWDYDNPGGDKRLYGGLDWFNVHPEQLPKAIKYVNEKAIPQIVELIRKYHPDILWFDTPSKLPLSENIRILKAIREVDNNVVVNGRLARNANISFGDYKNTSDRPAEFYPVTGDWEAIPTTNESYGYSKYDNSHKPAGFFIKLLAKAASRGGNLLMNIGPMGNGLVDPRDTVILHSIGAWMHTNGESIYGTTTSPLPLQPWGESTLKGKRLYLHVFNWPEKTPLYVGGLKSNIRKAWLLADPQQKDLPVKRVSNKDVTITLPATAPDSMNSVIVLDMQEVATDTVRVLDTHSLTNVLRAFDGALHGNGFKYGDGKAPRYYVFDWTQPNQYISWTFRLTQPGRFHTNIKYAADATTGENTFSIDVNGKTLSGKTQAVSSKDEKILTQPLNDLALPAGIHTLNIKPGTITGKELMKLFEINLIPYE